MLCSIFVICIYCKVYTMVGFDQLKYVMPVTRK